MQSHYSSNSTHPPLIPASGPSATVVPNSPPVDLASTSTDLQPLTSARSSRNQPQDGSMTMASDNTSPVLDTIVTLRVLLTTKGAGVCIGVKGATIDALRTVSGARAGVSKLVEGVNDRVLSVSGTVPQVTKATLFVAQTLVSHPVHALTTPLPQGTTTLRLLVPKAVMGSIIGRGGVNIKSMQDAVGVRIVTAKDALPGSTERVVDVTGVPQAIETVAQEFTRAIAADWERVAATTRLYDPRVRMAGGSRILTPSESYGGHGTHSPHSPHQIHHHSMSGPYVHNTAPYVPSGGHPRTTTSMAYVPTGVPSSSAVGGMVSPTVSNSSSSTTPGSPRGQPVNGGDGGVAEVHTQRILIPAGLVGGIIGRGGSRIAEIRHTSGATILISKDANANDEREFTVSGTQRQLGVALTMVYDQLAREKDRRLALEAQVSESPSGGSSSPAGANNALAPGHDVTGMAPAAEVGQSES